MNRILVIAAVAALAQAAHAGTCWIDHVDEAQDGLSIQFEPGPDVEIEYSKARAAGAVAYTASHGKIRVATGDATQGPEAGLVVHAGDHMRLRQAADDQCTLDALVWDGRLGVLVKQSGRLPNGKAVSSSEFLTP